MAAATVWVTPVDAGAAYLSKLGAFPAVNLATACDGKLADILKVRAIAV